MSNYTKTTDFAAKDTLVSGNALKIINGTEINTEFNGIQVAVNTKSNSNSPSFTGVPVAPTAATGTNTTQIATTGYVIAAVAAEALSGNAALQGMYPVGSIYINANVATNPNILFGFGTWIAYADGKVLTGAGSVLGSATGTGGFADAALIEHTHTATVTDPGHHHVVSPKVGAADGGQGFNTGWNDDWGTVTDKPTNGNTTGITVANSTTGTVPSGTNRNIPPYINVNIWKRTA